MAAKIEKWVLAQKKHKLSERHTQMARELGLNPDKLGKIDNHKQETWKAPLPQFIEEIYYKRFKREEPIKVYSLRELIAADKAKKQEKKNKKGKCRNDASSAEKNSKDNEIPAQPVSITAKLNAYREKPKAIIKLESGESFDSILQKEGHFFDVAFDVFEAEYVSLSQLGFALKKIHPKYKPRRYGCKTLREIYEKLDKYEVAQGEEIQVRKVVISEVLF